MESESSKIVEHSHNIDLSTVEGFGAEWQTFDQNDLSPNEIARLYDRYFSIFPFSDLPADAEGFDLGCGSGRWAQFVAQKVGLLHCIDASAEALQVAQRRLADGCNVRFHHASVDQIPLADESQDFGYSLGVLHHVPDSQAGLVECVRKLKSGAPFLLYLYYRFDNRPVWFRLLWRISNIMRYSISRLPFKLRRAITELVAALVYWPLARLARLAEGLGLNVSVWPLSAYRNLSYYTMRTDALDRFGTKLEQRFTRAEIVAMMAAAGLERIKFNERSQFWTAIGWKA